MAVASEGEEVFMMTVLQNEDEKVKYFVKVRKDKLDFNGFTAMIFEHFPQLKTVQFYMFYEDDDEKVIIRNASDYNIFYESTPEFERKVFIVMHPAKTSSFGISYENCHTSSQYSDTSTAITEKLDKFMENLTKENDNFKSTMLEDVKKMVDGHSETRQFAGSQERDELLTEMELRGQILEDMQRQNSRLLQQLREKDGANYKLAAEKHILEGRAKLRDDKIESLHRSVRTLEENERALQEKIKTLEEELGKPILKIKIPKAVIEHLNS